MLSSDCLSILLAGGSFTAPFRITRFDETMEGADLGRVGLILFPYKTLLEGEASARKGTRTGNEDKYEEAGDRWRRGSASIKSIQLSMSFQLFGAGDEVSDVEEGEQDEEAGSEQKLEPEGAGGGAWYQH